MLVPNVMRDRFIDDFFENPLEHSFGDSSNEMMKTDIRETNNSYELTMNLPGIKKENVQAELKDGYLTIRATSSSSTEDENKEGHYIRRERYSGTCARSFFIGENVKQEDIKARFEDGTLNLSIPKMEKKPVAEENHFISIEG